MEQFITGDVWKEVNKLLSKKEKKTACIAYVTSDTLQLAKGDILICDASTYTIKFGGTSAKTLNTYYKRGVKLFSNQDLHSKLLLTESFLVVGSANLSNSSAEKLTEASVVTHNDVLISQAKAFCYNLMKESKPLTQSEIDSLLKIEVVKRPMKPTTKSKTRLKKFGNSFWYVGVAPPKEKESEKVKEEVERNKIAISKKQNIEKEDIGNLQWRTNTEFGKSAMEGDQMMMRWYDDKSKRRSDIYPPTTILQKKFAGEYSLIFYNINTIQKKCIAWTKFQELLKNLNLQTEIGNRLKSISKNDADKLKQLWNKQR